MMRRCLTPSTMFAAILMLAAPPAPAGAASITTYRLSNNNPAGSPPITKVGAYVVPPGSIDDTTEESPLTILEGSSGFESSTDALNVLVGNGQVPEGEANAGAPLQGLALDFLGKNIPETGFVGKGFAPGGVLNFSLNLSPSTDAVPDLVLFPDSPAGLAIEQVPPTSVDVGGDTGVVTGGGNGGSGGDGGVVPVMAPDVGGNGMENQVPEPMSVVIWSVLAGLGLARARRLRRSSPRPT